jgi:hypothetical protein
VLQVDDAASMLLATPLQGRLRNAAFVEVAKYLASIASNPDQLMGLLQQLRGALAGACLLHEMMVCSDQSRR